MKTSVAVFLFISPSLAAAALAVTIDAVHAPDLAFLAGCAIMCALGFIMGK